MYLKIYSNLLSLLVIYFHFFKLTSLIKSNNLPRSEGIGDKFPKKLWCCVVGRVQQGNLVLSTELIT